MWLSWSNGCFQIQISPVRIRSSEILIYSQVYFKDWNFLNKFFLCHFDNSKMFIKFSLCLLSDTLNSAWKASIKWYKGSFTLDAGICGFCSGRLCCRGRYGKNPISVLTQSTAESALVWMSLKRLNWTVSFSWWETLPTASMAKRSLSPSKTFGPMSPFMKANA